ncbi:hypothetical protein FXV77_01230 [Sphingobacterium phlebotomi]|uniref:Phosphoenolpyruvate carboxykinase n=1 Tax=Sphingobacterium phlebotomi TaxID=2605433 RepID=A0A5D4HBC8_9SPHI|nr:hypothetical protein [Sphingobacterium phlebotomi]TYR37937.1 hypothetical protein FXV77_01230 [Sphingobacterium phlebotomi]
METNIAPELTNHYYEIAGLQLELRFPSTLNLDHILSSFISFRKEHSNGTSATVVTFMEEVVPLEEDWGTLRSDISLVWGDNFRFYEQENTFVTLIKHNIKDKQWMMKSTKDFRESRIYGKADDPRMGEFVSWLLMVVFGQVGLQHRLILIHASVIVYQEKQGVAFLGKSGTGKSTHSRLWLQHIPDTALLNDDNPVVRLEEDGRIMIYGTPWSGKTPCYKNKRVEFKGFVRLEQAPHNRFTWKKGMESLVTVLPSCTALRWNKDLFNAMTDTLSQLVDQVNVGHLECLPNADAAQISYKAFFEEQS